MKTNHTLLIQMATQLYTLGLDVETARESLRQMVAQSVPYESPQMLEALRRFESLKKQWDDLEQQYLSLRKEVQGLSQS